MNNEWKDVPEYYGVYKVSCMGEVKSIRKEKEKLIKPFSIRAKGYSRLAVTLSRNGAKKQFYVHDLVATLFLGDRPEGLFVDHKNRIPTDNRVENLRYCTPLENTRNASKQKRKCSSIYKGVYKRKKKWVAAINLNEKQVHIGTFESEEDAAKSYNIKAIELFGEFAVLNIIKIKEAA